MKKATILILMFILGVINLIVINLSADEDKLLDYKGKHFATSANCTWCHTNHFDKKLKLDVSIDREWAGSMMAHAAVDPFWQAKMASETIRHPKFRLVIEKKCSKCHTPMAYKESIFEKQPVSLLGKGFFNPKNKYHSLAMDGVSCTVCHQIKPMKDPALHFSGNYPITPTNDKDYSPIYGPFKTPFTGPMMNHTGYQPTYSSHIQKAELCSSCHTLHTPVIDKGKVVGKFPEQTPYLEMKHSAFKNDSCQKCHMVKVDQEMSLSTRPPWYEKTRKPFGRHTFQGANVFMLKLLRKNHQELKLKSSPQSLDQKIKLTEKFLQSKSARISLLKHKIENGYLWLTFKIENLAGHKLPTAYPSRRAWIHLKVSQRGKVIFESGRVSQKGVIHGDLLDQKGNDYERHYDVITSPSQVQIYQSLFSNYQGKLSFSLLSAAKYLKDNRLLPRGFDKAKASSDIKVVGMAAKDKNFVGGSDLVTYRIPLGKKESYQVTSSLKYQTIGHYYARDLFQFKEKSKRVARFEKMYRKADHTPMTLASGKWMIKMK